MPGLVYPYAGSQFSETTGTLTGLLLKTKGIQTSRSGVQRFCAKIDIRLYRPTYRSLRGNPEKQAQARQNIAELKKSDGG